MPPRGPNTKKETGRAKKAENEMKKKDAAATEKERKEAAAWAEGAKASNAKEAKEEKRRVDAARKAENARLLAEEEASLPSKVKPAPKAPPKKPANTQRSQTITADGGLRASVDKDNNVNNPESYEATGIDDALDLLTIVNAKSDKASVGQQASSIERHPERRFKAAFEAYQERELPIIKQEHPGLRLQQYKDLLYKQFQKSPDNPFNQTLVAYDATKEEKIIALNKRNAEVEERLRQKD